MRSSGCTPSEEGSEAGPLIRCEGWAFSHNALDVVRELRRREVTAGISNRGIAPTATNGDTELRSSAGYIRVNDIGHGIRVNGKGHGEPPGSQRAHSCSVLSLCDLAEGATNYVM